MRNQREVIRDGVGYTHHAERSLGSCVVKNDPILVVVGAASSLVGNISYLVEGEVPVYIYE